MKILLFAYHYWPSIGGVEKYVHELAKALIALGHDVDVVAGATVEGMSDADVHEGVRIHRFPALRSPLRARWWFWRHIGLFRQADVIHVSSTYPLEYLWRNLGLLIDPRKVFLTRHGMSSIYPVPDWEKRRAVRSLKLALSVVHDGAFIEKWLGVKPDHCLDQGLSPTADELQCVPEPPPTSAVYIGRLEPDSGIESYIDAVRILTRERGRDFTLNVYGEGSNGARLREWVEREQLPVQFHGWVERAQRHISESCLAFVDGRMAVQEAMARRRLVFSAYSHPLKRDYVCGESFSPYLIAVDNARELADRVDHYIENPSERAVLVARAHEYARTLTWARCAEAYVRLWKERLKPSIRPCSRWELAKLVFTLNREMFIPKTEWARGGSVCKERGVAAEPPSNAAAIPHS